MQQAGQRENGWALLAHAPGLILCALCLKIRVIRGELSFVLGRFHARHDFCNWGKMLHDLALTANMKMMSEMQHSSHGVFGTVLRGSYAIR